MSQVSSVAQPAVPSAPGRAAAAQIAMPSHRRRIVRRFMRNRRAVVGLVLLTVFVVMALFASRIAPFPPDAQVIANRLKPPSAANWMGTDALGRDVFSRAVYASQISMTIGIFAMVVAVGVGVTVGVLSGYYGGWIDNVLMRLTDMLLAFPVFFLLLTITALFGNSIAMLVLMLGITSWGVNARVVRGQVLSLRHEEFILAARAVGADNRRIITRHILPNILPIILVDATLRVALIILLEGGLSFLGVGVQPPMPSWGNMIAEGGEQLRRAWWVSVFPGLMLFLCTLSFNLVGDGLRDAFDPRMSR